MTDGLTTTVNLSNSGDTSQLNTSTTATLTDSTNDAPVGSSTLSDSETIILGSGAVVSSGTDSSTLVTGGVDGFSLYETGLDTYASTKTLSQIGAASLGYSEGYTGTETTTLGDSSGLTSSSLQIATTTLGTNAVVTSGTEVDSLYESAGDSSTLNGSGTNVRQFALSGAAADSSTYTTTFSVSGMAANSSNDSQTRTLTIGANDVILPGSTLTDIAGSADTATQSYTEHGNQTVSWGSGSSNAGTYTQTESTTLASSQNQTDFFALGTNGTISSGNGTMTGSLSSSDSMNDLESGTDVATDPAGGPALGGSYTQTSLTTTYQFSNNLETETFGAGALVTGGNNSFTFGQTNTESHNISVGTAGDTVTDSGYDTFSQYMQGTETYGSFAAVSSGYDSFTWAQTASDNLIITQNYGGTTLGAYTLYDITLDDQIYQNFYDVGTDTLGANDSIRGGVDSYTWGSARDLVSTLTDFGDSATPYEIEAYSSDQTSLGQTGTDSLATNGNIYSTVTYTYIEETSDNATVSQSGSGTGTAWQRLGSASDSYSVSDSGVITINDTTTTSLDNFALLSSHSISGSLTSTSDVGLVASSITDGGTDFASVSAWGQKSTSGDAFAFSDSESSDDDFSLNKTITGTMIGTASVVTNDGMNISGTTSIGGFSYTSVSLTSTSLGEAGSVTDDGVTTPFASLNILSVEVAYAVTPGTTDPLSTDASTSTSGNDEGANLTEVSGAGAAATAGVVVAGQLGGSPDGSAEHLGTSPNSLDTSSGLMSAMGGEGVHAMSFAGSEILPTANPAGTSLWLEESNQYGQTPTNWVSHPSGIGYRRSSPGVTTSGSGSGSGTTGAAIPGNPVTMDTGMSDAGTPAELSRIGNNFITGGNENPTAMQPGPISKAEQAAMPITPTGGPSAVGFGETDGRDVIGDAMALPDGSQWSWYGNPLYHPPSRASQNAHPSGSQQSGATGRGYGNGGYYNPPAADSLPPAAPPPPQAPPPQQPQSPKSPQAAWPPDTAGILKYLEAPPLYNSGPYSLSSDDGPAAPIPSNPKLHLGPGDLVIISGNYPKPKKGTAAIVPSYEDWQQRSKMRPGKFGGPGGGFMLSPTRPTTLRGLADALDKAIAANGGTRFRRIFIISHAGAHENGPALNLSDKDGQPDRLFYNSNGKAPRERIGRTGSDLLGARLYLALRPGGIFILGSCGYPNDPKMLRGYEKQWRANLAGWASALGVPTYALPGMGRPDLVYGVTAQLPNGDYIPLVGYGPDGKPIP